MVKTHTKQNNQFLIKKQQSTGLKHLNNSKPFIEHLNNMDNIYKYIEKYNRNRKQKNIIVFDDIIADILSKKKLNKTVTELFIRGR